MFHYHASAKSIGIIHKLYFWPIREFIIITHEVRRCYIKCTTESIIRIGYHMSGEVISVLSLEGRYYNCHERAQRARDNYNIVTRVIQLISPSQSCDNLFITYLCLYQGLNMENTETRSGCVLH